MMRTTCAGESAETTYFTGVAVSNGTMSIFSPRSSCTTACTRLPRMPTQAPTGSTSRVTRHHGDLGARTGLARRRLDAHDPLVHLGDLLLEAA